MVARLVSNANQGSVAAGAKSLRLGVVQVPVQGETECGDSWGVRSRNGHTIVVLADGLGHGPGAAEASREAVAALFRARELEPTALLENIHAALRSTRGAAVAIADINPQQGKVRFCGAGNVSAVLVNGANVQHMISHNGTAGHNIRKPQEFVYPWGAKTTMVMHSDGLTTSWRLEEYPGLLQHDPSLTSAVLFRDARRLRDDACVVSVTEG